MDISSKWTSEDKIEKRSRKEIMRVVKFGLFSISAGIIEVVSFELLNVFTSWDYWPKYLIALVLSIIWNFTLNRAFTFRSANNIPIAMLKVAAFYVVFTPVSTMGGASISMELSDGMRPWFWLSPWPATLLLSTSTTGS